MTITVQQAAVQTGKSESTIRKWIKTGKIKAHKQGQTWQIDPTSLEKSQANTSQSSSLDAKTIAKIASEVVSQILPLLQAGQGQSEKTEEPSQAEIQQQEIEILRQENQALSESIASLAMQVEALQACVSDLLHQPEMQTESQPAAHTQSKAEGNNEEQEMTIELEQDLSWLDEACHFKKAEGRTWRQLAKNYGDKISMNGKGLQSPRMYLHAIENWQDCKMEARVKAKIALEMEKIRA